MKTLAKIISYLFHPLLAGTYSVIIFFLSFDSDTFGELEEYKVALLASMFFMTFVVPALTFFIMKKKGLIKDLEMSDRKDRTIPYIYTLFCYAIAIYTMHSMLMPYYVLCMLAAGVLAILLLCLINLKWKVSAHCCGMSGLVAFALVQQIVLCTDLTYMVCFLIFLTGLVGSARIYLNSHNLSQTIVGSLIGFTFTFIAGILGFIIFYSL